MYYTVQELEKKFKKDRTTILRLARKKHWTVVKMKENGTLKNFYLKADVDCDLPTKKKREITEVEAIRVVPRKEATAVDELPAWNQDKAWARFFFCMKLKEAYETMDWCKEEIIKYFVANAENNYPEKYKIIKRLSVPTLRRWYGVYLDNLDNPLALASGNGYNKGMRKISKEVLEDAISLYKSKNKVSIRFVHERLILKHGLEAISYATLRNILNKDISTLVKDKWRMGAKEFKDTHKIFVERDYTSINVGDIWESDGHDIETFCYHPFEKDSKGERAIRSPKLVAWMDVKSRLITGWTLSWTENTESIAIALKNGISKYGKPKKLYTDNGKAYKSRILKGDKRKAYKSKALKNDDEFLDGIYGALGLEVTHALPYNAQAKHIERWFLDFKNDFARGSIAFKGGHILERKEELKTILKDETLKKHILEEWELEEYIEAYIEYKNHMYYKTGRKGHRGHGMNGRTPLEVFDEELPVEEREMLSEEKLRLLFLYEEVRTVQQNGITYLDNTYIADELYKHLKEKVKVKYDPHNLEFMYIYLMTGEFLCKATKLNKIGFNDIDGYKEHTRRLKRLNKITKESLLIKEEIRDNLGIIELSAARQERKEIVEKMKALPNKKKEEADLVYIGGGLYEEIK